MASAFPKYIRFTFRDDDSESIPLELPPRRMWPAGLVVAVFFAIFATIEVVSLVNIRWNVRDVFDLMFALFQVFWVLGWSVGVLFLGALTALLLFYRESARIQRGNLVHAPALGPLKIVCRYDLAKVNNLRLEPIAGSNQARIRFDFEGRKTSIGDAMHRVDAEDIVGKIRSAMPAVVEEESHPHPDLLPSRGKGAPEAPPPPLRGRIEVGGTRASTLALLAANLLPLIGVLVFGWKLSHVMVLYWAESAVIGFYTVLKMFKVAKLVAIPASMFFVGHFGGFMAGHFMFVYMFFVRGVDATGPDAPVLEALLQVFGPLWFALAALLVSHGISFAVNFLGCREYETAKLNDLMTAPYKRIFVMHLTIIFGGWLVMLLKTPLPALALLIALKTAVDMRAHVREHGRVGA